MGIPANESGALTWMLNFADGLVQDPAKYMISSADADAVNQAVQLFNTNRTIALDPATRTAVTVAAKDDSRTAAEQICRAYAKLIKYNSGISDPDKIAIGVTPENNSRQPIPCPQTSPLLSIIAATPGVQTVRFSDSMTPDARKKPFGASEIQIFVAVDDAAVTDPQAAEFLGKFTKNPISVPFSSQQNGKQATYFARWASRRGDTGPWSLPVSMVIAA